MASVLSGLILLALCGLALAQKPPVLEIDGLGKVQGNRGTSRSGRSYERYRGIRFGQSPNATGRRFLPALDEEPWLESDEPRDALQHGRHCTQLSPLKGADFYTLHRLGQDDMEEYAEDDDLEDCLFTHVYTPKRAPTKLMPVMVWFHGGAFLDGSSLIYGPKFFMDHDVVIVVPHYRLGPLGFMSLDTDEIPGNAGMFDQVQALQWVQKYIHSFGGDKNQVTIFGESAGGASVSLLAISPLAKGLFTKVIAQSGAALDEWTIDREARYNGMGIAAKVGCEGTEEELDDIAECLRNVPALDIIKAYKYGWKPEQTAMGKTGFGGCTPVIQKAGVKKFIDKEPLAYWSDPDFKSVPAMYGANKHEGTYVMAIAYADFLKPNDLVEDEEFLKHDVMNLFLNIFGIKDRGYFVSDAADYSYIGGENMGNLTAMIPGLVDFGGVAFLKGASYENLMLHKKFGDSYWYTFNFNGRATLWPFIASSVCVPFPGGVCHANELLMIWNIPVLGDTLDAEEKALSQQMTEMWYNFAAFGEPNPASNKIVGVPEIPSWDKENKTYIRLDSPILSLMDFTKEYTIARDEKFAEGFNQIC